MLEISNLIFKIYNFEKAERFFDTSIILFENYPELKILLN